MTYVAPGQRPAVAAPQPGGWSVVLLDPAERLKDLATRAAGGGRPHIAFAAVPGARYAYYFDHVEALSRGAPLPTPPPGHWAAADWSLRVGLTVPLDVFNYVEEQWGWRDTLDMPMLNRGLVVLGSRLFFEDPSYSCVVPLLPDHGLPEFDPLEDYPGKVFTP